MQDNDIDIKIAQNCKSKNIKLAVCESCTGGEIARKLVERKGASDFFLGSMVCYSDIAKQSVLNVPSKVLKENFAESAECALEMLLGLKKLFPHADALLATTGFLDSNTGEKPANLGGKVFIGVAIKKEFSSDEIFQLARQPTCGTAHYDFLSGRTIGISPKIVYAANQDDFLYSIIELKMDTSADRLFNMQAACKAAFHLLELMFK